MIIKRPPAPQKKKKISSETKTSPKIYETTSTDQQTEESTEPEALNCLVQQNKNKHYSQNQWV